MNAFSLTLTICVELLKHKKCWFRFQPGHFIVMFCYAIGTDVNILNHDVAAMVGNKLYPLAMLSKILKALDEETFNT